MTHNELGDLRGTWRERSRLLSRGAMRRDQKRPDLVCRRLFIAERVTLTQCQQTLVSPDTVLYLQERMSIPTTQ